MMIMSDCFFCGSALFGLSSSPPLVGMPSWANLRFVLKNGERAHFTGLGLYGVFFDDRLIYVGKFLGKKTKPLEGDVREARWSKHLGSMTLRARNISFSKLSRTRILEGVDIGPQFEIKNVDARLLTRDRGCLSTYNRFTFGAEHWEDFKHLDDATINRFGFGYVRVSEYFGDAADVRKLVSDAEGLVVSRLKPRCNSVISEGKANLNVLYDQFLSAAKEALGSQSIAAGVMRPSVDSFILERIEEGEVDNMMNAESAFYDRVASSDLARGLVTSLVDNFVGDPFVEIHYKCPERPQLRVRDLRQIPGKRTQNIFTLEWQPRNQRFCCRALADNSFCSAHGAIDVRVPSSKSEPLRSEFNYLATGSLAQLVAIINESILRR